jgi:tetratricopeptide (TPR) repeat protein
MPAAGHEVSDDGTALLIRPDEREHRTYRLLGVRADGEAVERGALTVETVYRFDARADGELVLAMTDDELYLFREGRKVRFTAERRVSYIDAALATESGHFTCGFTDPLSGACGIALGDGCGRRVWARHLEGALARVAIAPDAVSVLAGLQEGAVLCLARDRTLLWEHAQPEPVAAAFMFTGGRALIGTEEGTLLALDPEGGVAWRAALGLPICALAAGASLIAAAASDGSRHNLTCMDAGGSPAWELELEAAPTGLSVSPGGEFLLATCADGAGMLFRAGLRGPRAASSPRRDGELTRAREARADAEVARAAEALGAFLRERPHDLEAARELARVRSALMAGYRSRIEAEMAAGRHRAAMEVLDAAAALEPWEPELFRLRSVCRTELLAAAQLRARGLEESRDWEAAARAWLEVLELDPVAIEAREALAETYRARAEGLLEQGDALRAAGDLAGAIARWEEALELYPAETLVERLREAEIERCLAAGMAHYERRRGPEAAFQFRKVLTLEPGHEQAARYLRYAEGLTGDTEVAERFTRLE